MCTHRKSIQSLTQPAPLDLLLRVLYCPFSHKSEVVLGDSSDPLRSSLHTFEITGKEISQPGFIDVDLHVLVHGKSIGFPNRNPIDLRRVFLCYVNISACIFDHNGFNSRLVWSMVGCIARISLTN